MPVLSSDEQSRCCRLLGFTMPDRKWAPVTTFRANAQPPLCVSGSPSLACEHMPYPRFYLEVVDPSQNQ